MTRRVAAIAELGPLLAVCAFLVWESALPRLDPTGQEDSAAAVRAMVEGRAVFNVATRWPMTYTGWPIFGRYGVPESEGEKR